LPADPAAAAVSDLAQTANSLDPAKPFLNPPADSLNDHSKSVTWRQMRRSYLPASSPSASRRRALITCPRHPSIALKVYDLIANPAFIVVTVADEFHAKTTAPNQLWQTKFTYFRVIGSEWFYLSTILDDFSRYIAAWQLCATMAASDVTDTLELALAASGLQPGKLTPKSEIERWRQMLKNRVFIENYYLFSELETQLAAFIDTYNNQRYRKSLNYITSADLCSGRGKTILLERERIRRQRSGADACYTSDKPHKSINQMGRTLR
jgi:transposase InsO family protein